MYGQRQRGAQLVQKYYRPKKELLDKIESNAISNSSCLAIHISRAKVDQFIPYVDAYVRAASTLHQNVTVFLATHDRHVSGDLVKASNVLKPFMIQTQQPQVLLRPQDVDIFEEYDDERHRLNLEVLAHMYLLSQCDFFLHGNFVVAEAAIYINPSLHNTSVNVALPVEQRMTPQQFGDLVRSKYDASGRV